MANCRALTTWYLVRLVYGIWTAVTNIAAAQEGARAPVRSKSYLGRRKIEERPAAECAPQRCTHRTRPR